MRPARERAAGGVVGRGGRVLLVRVVNLQGERRWTFPKGHLEAGERPLAAALREVEEETGWRCRPAGLLGEVRYRFRRNGRPVRKSVRWYRMEPLEKVGLPDAAEVVSARWVEAARAGRLLSYPGDLRLLGRYRGRVTQVSPRVPETAWKKTRPMSDTFTLRPPRARRAQP